MATNSNLFNRLMQSFIGTPDTVVVKQDDYYKPLVEQVDWLEQNKQVMDDDTLKQWNNIGYNTIRDNAYVGNTSGLGNLKNFMDNAGLETNRVSAGLETIPGKRGFIGDLTQGFKENYTTPFDIGNLQPNENKGIASRIGEGLGTLARGIDSPIGRAATAYGLTKVLGGDTDIAAINALNAGVINQNLRTQDQLYRQGLKEQGIDSSEVGGYITDDVYKNYSNSSYKLRDLIRKESATQASNELIRLKAERQSIENSTLPEMQKAKLIQENAKAQYAVEMQLAKIQAYENSTNLGYGRLGLQQAGLDLRRQEYEDKKAREDEKQRIIKELLGDNPQNTENGGKVF